MRRGPRATNCSYLAPLRRCAPLSPVDGRAPLASETPAPLSVVLAVLSSAAPLLSSPRRSVPSRPLPSVRVRPVGWPKC